MHIPKLHFDRRHFNICSSDCHILLMNCELKLATGNTIPQQICKFQPINFSDLLVGNAS